MRNTGALIEAVIQTPGGRINYEGDTAIDGVPGTAAPIFLFFSGLVILGGAAFCDFRYQVKDVDN